MFVMNSDGDLVPLKSDCLQFDHQFYISTHTNICEKTKCPKQQRTNVTMSAIPHKRNH